MGKREIKPKFSFRVKINSDFWKIRLFSRSDFQKKWKNCVAITEYEHYTPDLEINFSGPKVSRDTVAHELFHAMLSYKNYSHLKADTVEERLCEVIGKKYKILYLLTEKVYGKLTNRR